MRPTPELTPADPATENRKLRKINAALMDRIERAGDLSGDAFTLFQTAMALENEVRLRTDDLSRAMTELRDLNLHLRRAKEEAEQARADLAGAIDAVQEGFALFGADERLVTCNATFRGLLPSVKARIRPGLRFEDYAALVAWAPELGLEDDSARKEWLAMRLELHGRPHASFNLIMADERWLQVSERRTPNGGAAILQTDITDMVLWERNERDKRLDQQARHIRATLDHMNQGVCVFDFERRLQAWNDQARVMLGLPFNLLKAGARFERIAAYFARGPGLNPPENARRLAAWIGAPAALRAPLEVALTGANGRVLDASCAAIPGGGFVISFTDVTDREREAAALERAKATLEQRVADRTADLTALNQRLMREIGERKQAEADLLTAKEAAERANLSKTRFLAAASHDLLQPLNAARLFIAAFEAGALTPEQAGMIGRIDSAFETVEALLNALLEISKLDAGGMRASPGPVAAMTVLAPIVDQFRPLAARRGLKLRLAPTQAVLHTDPEHLRRAVQNLVANAVKYTREGGVLVGCRRRGDGVSIEVWDTGVGVEPADHARIFEEFQRAGTPNADSERGMGLGLAIVRRVCALLDHPLRFDSRPGRGSVFAIQAPRSDAAAPRPPALRAAAGGETPDGMIALLIDDEAEIRAGMEALLDGWGVATVSAGSLDQAISAAEQLGMAPDVIVADYHLGEEATGLAVIAALRARFQAEIPAILTTADRSEAVAAAARAEKVHLLTKPVRLAALRALLQWASQRRDEG